MALRQFTVKNGTEQMEIEFEDDLPWGQMRPIIERSVDFSGVAAGNLKIMPDKFAFSITLAAIRKPENLRGNVTNFDKLPQSVAMDIMEGICDAYPLKDFLMRAGRLMRGPQKEPQGP